MKKIHLYLVFSCIVIFCVVMLVHARIGKSHQALVRVNPAFREYVQAFTSGIVSTASGIKVRLNDDFADSVVFGSPLKNSYFRFKPEIKGKTYWSDSRTLEFIPDEKLPQDQVYTAEFYLSQLLTVPDSMKTMIFQFHTMVQELTVEVDNHKAYSHADLSKEHMNGTVQTSDMADNQQVEKILKAMQGGRNLIFQLL